MTETKTTNLSIRMDKTLKDEADELFSALGLNLTTAVTIFIRQAVMQRRIPFEIKLEPNRKEADEFRRLFSEMRTEAGVRGFLTDEEIDAEIKAARAERNLEKQGGQSAVYGNLVPLAAKMPIKSIESRLR